MDALYVQTLIRQELKIGTEGFAFTIPECKITNVILSKNISAVRENINTIFNRLYINFATLNQKYEISPKIQEIDLNFDLKIGESKEIKIFVNTADSKFLYKIYIVKTNINYALNV